MVPSCFALLTLLVGCGLLRETSAQFDFKNLDPGKLARVVETVGKHSNTIVAVLQKPDTQKALVEAFQDVQPKDVVQASAQTIEAAKAEGPGPSDWWSTPSPGEAVDAGAAAASKAPAAPGASHTATGAPALHEPASASQQHMEDALESLGRGLDQGAHLLDDKSKNLKQEVNKALPSLAWQVPNALSGLLKDEHFKKDLEATLSRETPNIAKGLKDIDPKQVQELLKHSDKDVGDVMWLLSEYKWWCKNWPMVLGTVMFACVTLVIFNMLIQRLCCRRSRKHGPTVEFNMWVGTGPQQRDVAAESMESGFQQF